ncbi:MAG: Gfo/Idh/MocA family oxidoreductase [Burkholderiaceae bacterium]|nr:Gfo/Idh/MocA family oxidoreductase [Burkholderiaceae bacterium]
MGTRLLVTGRGSIAQRHVRHARELLPGVEIAVVSATGELDSALQPCERVADFSQGLRWRPDAVVIASVSTRHAQELQACLAAGLPCLAEKPLLTRRDEWQALTAAACDAAHASAVVVGCNLRYLPALDRLAAALHEPQAGALVRAQLEVGQDLRQWRPGRDLAHSYSGHAAQGGGVLFDLVHEVDQARRLLGPLTVVGATAGRLSSLPIDSDDVHVALLRSASGAPVTIGLDYVARPTVRRYAFILEQCTLVCDLIGRQLTRSTSDGVELLASGADFDMAATYRAQMVDWIASWSDPGHAVKSPLNQGLDSAELMLRMKEATTP